MTFSEVVGSVLDFCGQSSGGDFEKMVKVLVNEKYRLLLDLGEIPHEQRVFTLTTVSGTCQYGLPSYVRHVVNIEDPTTPAFIYQTNARFFDKNYPGNTDSGTPTFAYPIGTRGVQRKLTANAKLNLLSSSALDTGGHYKVRVTGFVVDAFSRPSSLQTELVTLTGATSVSTANTYDYSLGVERFTKEPATGYTFSGTVYAYQTIPTVPAVEISPAYMSSDYLWLEFYPIPSAAITYNVRCEMKKAPLVNDGDWPEIDAAYHMLLVFGVTQDILAGLGKTSVADRHRNSYAEMEKRFIRANNRSPNSLWSFQDVQTGVGPRNRPQRPLIRGVDFGYVA